MTCCEFGDTYDEAPILGV